jgi:hypothetical protein
MLASAVSASASWKYWEKQALTADVITKIKRLSTARTPPPQPQFA